MKQNNTESIFLLGAGPLAAILLGLALVPLRGFTSASNFSFAFMALTIVVAEYGGVRAAVATALCSALSLDFFLTQPYLQLTIADKHDIIALVGLTVCGLIAAAVSSQRGERAAALRAALRQLDMLDTAVGGLESTEPLESRLGKVLDAMCVACPIAGAVVRDENNTILAATERGQGGARAAVHILAQQTLLPRGSDAAVFAEREVPFPSEGAALALVVGNRRLGWLDLWGNGVPANSRSRRSLSDAARLLAIQLAGARPGEATRNVDPGRA
jgi:K+-sensing histidine kinase KdpD